MSRISISRRVFLVILVGGTLTVVRGVGRQPLAYAAAPTPDKAYVAVFSREDRKQPFAIIEKPADVPIGNGSRVVIDAFALRVEPIDAAQAKAFLHRLPALNAGESQKLPPGFRVYADRGAVEVSYAGGSQKWKLSFTDPADIAGEGGGGGGGNGGGGSM